MISLLVSHTDSENPSTTITALLASLNSCCNPWIYMFFSGHLLQDCVQSFPCCQSIAQKFAKDDSDSMSRRQTSYSNNRSPTNSTGTWKDSPKSSKSIRFIPVSTWAAYPRSQTLGRGLCVQLESLRVNMFMWHRHKSTQCIHCFYNLVYTLFLQFSVYIVSSCVFPIAVTKTWILLHSILMKMYHMGNV